MSGAPAVDSRAGWRVVAGGGFVVGFGVQTLFFTTFGLFMLPIAQSTGWSRVEIAFAGTLQAFLAPALAPFFGWVVDRAPLRRFMMVGVVLQSANIAAFGLLGGSVWNFYALSILLSFTGLGASVLATSKIVQGWFDRSLGRAMGLLFACVGVSAIVQPLLAQALIDGVGWRRTYFVLGLLGLIVAGVAAWSLVRVRPEADPDRTRAGLSEGSGSTSPRGRALPTSLLVLLRDPTWWWLALWNILFGFGWLGVMFHLPAMMQDRGATPAQSALGLSMLAAGGLLGTLGSGWLVDHMPARRLASMNTLVPLIAVLLLLGSTNVWTGLAAGIVFGLCGGTDGTLSVYFVRRFFGSAIYGRAFATQGVATSIGGGLAPWLAALLQQRTGNYDGALLAAAVAFGAAALVPAFFPREVRSGSRQPEPTPA